MKSLETQIAELNESIKAKDAKIAELTESLKTADRTAAQGKLKTLCTEAALPAVAVAKLTEAFKEAVSDQGMKEAVNTEKKYIESLGVAKPAIVRNNGAAAADSSVMTEADRKTRQEKAWGVLGCTEAETKKLAR